MQLEGRRLCLRIETRFDCEFGHWMALMLNGGKYFANYVQQNKCSLGINLMLVEVGQLWGGGDVGDFHFSTLQKLYQEKSPL